MQVRLGSSMAKRSRRQRAPLQRGLSVRGTRGGYRYGAGRKRIAEHKRTFVAHRRRPSLPKQTPVHVTLRAVKGVATLRRPKPVRYIRRCIQLAHKDRFRIIEFSIQGNHLHLIVEAEDRRALARGMQGLKVRLARRLNALFGREGTFFTERYHARQIRTPREARHCYGYVLNNARKHAAEQGRTLARNWIDPFSSAPTFTGWAGATITSAGATREEITRPAEFYLLTRGWKRYGPLDPNAVPGPSG
jgi:REP element-mobilizing transposase RayT